MPMRKSFTVAVRHVRACLSSEEAVAGPRRLPSMRSMAATAGVQTSVMKAAVRDLMLCGEVGLEGKRQLVALELTDTQQRAHRYVHAEVKRACAQRTTRLPTLRDLATGTHVALGTMSTVVNRLVVARILASSHRRGITIVAGSSGGKPRRSYDTTHALPRTTWEAVAAALDRDILGGLYRSADQLPPVKHLTDRYQASHETVRRALGDLTQRGILTGSGRKYRVALLGGHQAGGAIVLVARGTPDGDFSPLTCRTLDELRNLEEQCSLRGIELIVAIVNDSGLSLPVACRKYRSFEDMMRKRAVLGFLVWGMGLWGFDPIGVVHRLAAFGHPISVLDHGEEKRLVAGGAYSAAAKLFSPADGRTAGRVVGRYLLALGHRRIAYVSPDHKTPHSRNRLAALVDEFTSAGFAGGVVPFTCAAKESALETNPGVNRRAGQLMDYLRRLGWIAGIDGHELPRQVLENLQYDILSIQLRRQETRQRLYPLLDQVMAEPGITAVVCMNDLAGIETLYFCNAHNIAVPGRLSIVGFDNSNEAVAESLTSYDFRISAAWHGMIDHVLNPRLRPWRSDRDPPITVAGFVQERGSTARRGL